MSLFQVNLLLLLVLLTFSQALESSQLKKIREKFDLITQQIISEESTFWHSYRLNSGIHNREEIKVTKVVEHETFKYDSGVLQWFHLNLIRSQLLIGLIENGFHLVSFNSNGTVINNKTIDLHITPVSVSATRRWNKISHEFEGIIACSSKNESHQGLIEWFKITHNLEMEKLTMWKLDRDIIHKKFIETDNSPFLIILTKYGKSSFIDVYKYSLDDLNNFWLLQHLSFQFVTDNFVINSLGRLTFLSVPNYTNHSIEIYKLNTFSFEPFQTLVVLDFQTIVGFKINFNSFLMVGGEETQIFRFTKKAMLSEIIDNISMGLVTNILPVKVKSFRDEVVLLVEHQIDYSTHKSVHVELMMYHDGIFQGHDNVPCLHFGVITNGLSCLVQEDYDIGIKGGVALEFKSLNESRILLPRYNLSSELFSLETELISVPNPVQEEIKSSLEMRTKIIQLYKKQQIYISQAERRLKMMAKTNPNAEIFSRKVTNDLESASSIKVEHFVPPPSEIHEMQHEIEQLEDKIVNLRELIERVAVKNQNDVTINQSVWIFGQLSVTGDIKIKHLHPDLLNGRSVNEVLNNVLRADRFTIIRGQKILTNVSVDEIDTVHLNGIDSRLIPFNAGGRVEIHGDITFQAPVHVHQNVFLPRFGKVNNIDLSEEVVHVNKPFQGNLILPSVTITEHASVIHLLNNQPVPHNLEHFMNQLNFDHNVANITANSLQISGNLETETINGIDFNDLLNRMYLKNVPSFFPGETFVEGDIFMNSDINTNGLNGLLFPSDYLMRGNEEFSSITGKKTFTGTLSALEAIVHGTIDTVDLNDVIPLTTNQTVIGNFLFNDLEITESLEVNGEIKGQGLSNFLSNPSLSETNVIKSNIIFTNLVVNGDIVVEDFVNGTHWNSLLEDIIYKDEKSVNINSVKTFANSLAVEGNLEIISNKINNQDISSFILKDSNNIFKNKRLNGLVVFENLDVTGLYAGINVTELNDTVVKVNEDQIITSDITIESIANHPSVFALGGIQITESFNEKSLNDFLMGHKSKSENVTASILAAENITVLGNLILMGQNLSSDKINYNAFYSGNINELTVDFINGIPIAQVQTLNDNLLTLDEKILNGKIKCKEILVKGNVVVKQINEFDLDEISNNAFCVNQVNSDVESITFMNDVTFEKLELQNWNSYNFDETIKDLVWRNEENVTLGGAKTFSKGFIVDGNIEADLINGYSASDYIHYSDEYINVLSPVEIYGNLSILNEINVNNFNGIPMKELTSFFEFMESGDLIIHNNLSFTKSLEIQKLFVDGQINGVLSSNLNNMVYKNDSVGIKGNFLFTNDVYFEKDLFVQQSYNGLNLPDIFDNIVIKDKTTYFSNNVVFTCETYVKNVVEISHDLSVDIINGCDLNEWKSNSIYLNSDHFIEEQIVFENVTVLDHISVSYLNDINMSKLILLHEDQEFDTNITFIEISSMQQNIPVKNTVNNLNLDEEYHNTVFVTETNPITIETPIVFHNSVIAKNLNTSALIAGIDLNRIVTTDTDQELFASYQFNEKVVLMKNLTVDYLIDIDPKKLLEKGVTLNSEKMQNITGKWAVYGNVIIEENIAGNGMIDQFDVNDFLNRKHQFALDQTKYATKYKKHFLSMCNDVHYLLEQNNKKIYFFKYMEIAQEVNAEYPIETIHHFQSKGDDYLIISYANSCESRIYKWSKYDGVFLPNFLSFKVSPVSQWITVQAKNKHNYLVSRSVSNELCNVSGVNIWKFEDTQMKLVHKMSFAELLQQSKKNDVFYALDKHTVYEYNVKDLKKRASEEIVQKWELSGAHKLRFVNPEMGIGLSLTDGKKIFKLNTQNKSTENFLSPRFSNINFENDEENFSTFANYYIPNSETGESIVINVGRNSNRKRLIVIASHEQTMVKGPLDFIKIYENVIDGKLFHKIPSFKPSSLNSLEFDNGETFLVFLENSKVIKFYQYKGIEGFKYHSSINLTGDFLINLNLNLGNYNMKQKYLLLVNGQSFTLLQAVLFGDQSIVENFQCSIPDY